MPTLIDELVVALNLDTSKFTQAQAKALEDAKKYVDNLKTQAKEVEGVGRHIGEMFTKLKQEAVSFVGLSFGGYEFKQMIDRITNLDASIGRTARTANITIPSLSKWMNMIQYIGGNAEEASSSIAAMNRQIVQQMNMGIAMPAPLRAFLNMTGAYGIAQTGGPDMMDKVLTQIRSFFVRSHMDPADFSARMAAAGFSEGMINLIVSQNFRRIEEAAARLHGATDISAASAQRLQEAQGKLAQSWDALARVITVTVGPALAWMMDKITTLFGGWARTEEEEAPEHRATRRHMVRQFGSPPRWMRKLAGMTDAEIDEAERNEQAVMRPRYRRSPITLHGEQDAQARLASIRQNVAGMAGEAGQSTVHVDWTTGAVTWDSIDPTTRLATARPSGVSQATLGGLPLLGLAGGTLGDPRNMIPTIRKIAKQLGIDPDIAVRVAASEGLADFYGDRNRFGQATSFGAMQLHVTGPGGGAVGDLYKAQTGRDPSDPRNEMDTIRFGLEYAKTHGWGAWMGAPRAGVSPWMGIPRGGAQNTTTSSIHVGTININTQATDARGIAREIKISLANTGLTG